MTSAKAIDPIPWVLSNGRCIKESCLKSRNMRPEQPTKPLGRLTFRTYPMVTAPRLYQPSATRSGQFIHVEPLKENLRKMTQFFWQIVGSFDTPSRSTDQRDLPAREDEFCIRPVCFYTNELGNYFPTGQLGSETHDRLILRAPRQLKCVKKELQVKFQSHTVLI